MTKLSPEDQKKQELYRDARTSNKYDEIWQGVNKCVFCDLKDKYIFFEENGVVMTIQLFAYIDGHFMIIPRRHVKSPKELTEIEWETIRKFTYIAKKLIKKVHGIKGMQISQKDGSDAQSTVDHIHFHCIPFDKPDLSIWNYRKLKYTPLENVELYRNEKKTIVKSTLKFDDKYRTNIIQPIICDVIIVNINKQVLMQVRRNKSKLINDYLSLPGGNVDDFNISFEDELAREIYEETNYSAESKDLELFLSRPGGVGYQIMSTPLEVEYTHHKKFIHNTYILNNFDEKIKIKPGDDCEELVWIDIDTVKSHPRISEPIGEAILAYAKR